MDCKYLFGVFLTLSSSFAQAQQPDPSIGRNIPGSVPSAPSPSVVTVDNTVEASSVFPVGRVAGRPGSSQLKSIEFTSGKSAQPVPLIEGNAAWAFALRGEAVGQLLTAELAQQVARATPGALFRSQSSVCLYSNRRGRLSLRQTKNPCGGRRSGRCHSHRQPLVQ
jgi:hypothetical protein